MDLIRRTGHGSRDWTRAEVAELFATGEVEGFTGHHINRVEDFPEWAGDPRNIVFLSNTPGGGDHLYSPQGHRGNWANPTSGRLIDRATTR
jgi:hypothetical protein